MTNAQAGGTYLYAVLADTLEVEGWGPMGVEGGEVDCIRAGRLSALVSRVSRARLRPERKHLLAHQAVLRRAMEHVTVSPAVFGLIARDEEAVRALLLESEAMFLEQLARVAGKVEMGLKVSWSAPELFEYFVEVHPELQEVRDALKGRDGVGREELIEVGKLFARIRDADRQAHGERVAAVLEARGIELKWNPPKTEREVMNLACLVPREALGTFEQMVAAAAAGFDDHFTFEFNGPWAPHSFTELALKLQAA